MCVCVRERERERERQKDRARILAKECAFFCKNLILFQRSQGCVHDDGCVPNLVRACVCECVCVGERERESV